MQTQLSTPYCVCVCMCACLWRGPWWKEQTRVETWVFCSLLIHHKVAEDKTWSSTFGLRPLLIVFLPHSYTHTHLDCHIHFLSPCCQQGLRICAPAVLVSVLWPTRRFCPYVVKKRQRFSINRCQSLLIRMLLPLTDPSVLHLYAQLPASCWCWSSQINGNQL